MNTICYLDRDGSIVIFDSTTFPYYCSLPSLILGNPAGPGKVTTSEYVDEKPRC